MLTLAVTFLVRVLLVALFLPFSALDKVLNFDAAEAQAAQALPGWLAPLLIGCGLGIEIVMSLAILTGYFDRIAAFILAIYCIVTALLWKQFWRTPDFRLRGSGDRALFWDFLKNVALAGGFLLLTFGTDASGVRRFIDHPLQSSNPYARPDRSQGAP
ncbi:MAG TPA: DoxX family protein [Rhizomicrobium sp.]